MTATSAYIFQAFQSRRTTKKCDKRIIELSFLKTIPTSIVLHAWNLVVLRYIRLLDMLNVRSSWRVLFHTECGGKWALGLMKNDFVSRHQKVSKVVRAYDVYFISYSLEHQSKPLKTIKKVGLFLLYRKKSIFFYKKDTKFV